MVVAMVAKVGKEARCQPFPPPEIAGLIKGRLIHHHHPLTRPGLRSAISSGGKRGIGGVGPLDIP